jgi:hypothetical protein
MSKDISFHTQSIRNQNPPEGKKLTSETLSLQFPVPVWTKNPINWTQKEILLQDIKICDFQNIEITQSIAVCKISGSVARASERASGAFARAREKGTQEGTTGSTFWSREDDDNSADCSAWNCHHLRVLGSSSYHWNITPPVFLFLYFCFFSLIFFYK